MEDQPSMMNYEEDNPSLPGPSRPEQWQVQWSNTRASRYNKPPKKSPRQLELEADFDKSKRTIGIIPCSKRRIQQHEQDPKIVSFPPTKRKEAAQKMALVEYCRQELNMTEEEAESLKTNKAFFPHYEGKKKIMYIEFADQIERAKVTNRKNFLTPNEDNPDNSPEIIPYISNRQHPRYKALEKHAWEVRVKTREEGRPLQTNIRLGIDDMEYRTRPAHDNPDVIGINNYLPEPWRFI